VGGVTAVAVFDHKPTAHELLERRLARGWHPTPSRLKDGHRVLGYAACVFQTPELEAKTTPGEAAGDASV
jgi:hypothetical protein